MQTTAKLAAATLTGIGLASMTLAACTSADSDGGSSNSAASDSCWPPASCGVGPGTQCVAWHDNTASTTLSFRMSQLEVLKPAALAGQFLQDNVVSKGVSLSRPQCYQEGTGLFTWLLELDTSTNLAKTGGAHVQLNPTEGYCYINQELDGFFAKPVEVAIETTVSGTDKEFKLAQTIQDIAVPIFLTDDETSAIILPLHDVMISDGRISANGNCIGRWAGDELDYITDCKPDRNEGQKTQWISGARLTGYILVQEADDVWIPEITQTLCVALSGSVSTYTEDFVDDDRKGKRCKREGEKILAAEKADWCSATNSACSPPEADSFRLEGTFAASAVKIHPTCP